MTRFFRISLNPGFQDNLPRFVFYSGKFQKNMASHFGLLDKRMNSTTDKEQPVRRKCYFCPVHVIFEVLKLPLNLESLFSFNFQLKKKLRPNFAFWDTFKLLRCLNSKEINLQSSIRVTCILLDLISVQLKI